MIILQQTRGNLSSGDQLALDLPFAETKSLAARIGPTPIFSRASGATYVGSDGLIHGIDTSTTSNTIGTGSKTFTLTATAGQDQLWRTGDAVEAANGTNSMVGTVTSYDANTQVLVCNMTSISGTGTFTSWRIGYRGPRFDHDPVSPFACRGLLIEEGGRSNNVTQSGSMNLWTGAGGSTRAVSTVDSPDGNKATIGTSGGSSFGGIIARSLSSFTSTIGTQYTASCFIKKDNWRYVSIDFAALRPAGPTVPFFDLDTLTFNANGSATTGVIIPYPNGWYRLAVSGAATSAISTVIDIILTTSTGQSNASVGGLVAYIWGAQLEVGAFPTSYIPTTTSTAARAADTCNITGGAFNSFYNQSEGTLFADVSGLMNTTLSGNRTFVSISNNTYTNVFTIYKNSGSAFINAEGTTNGLQQFYYVNAYSPSTQYKMALGFKTNDARLAFNGTLGTADTSVTMPTTMNRLELRDPTGAAGGQPTGHIAAIRYYKKRLPNAKLQALTV